MTTTDHGDAPLGNSLLARAIAELPTTIRAGALVEYAGWVTTRERLTREVGLVADGHRPAHELAAEEAERRQQAGDPAAPLWAAGAETMRLRAETDQLEHQFTEGPH